MPPTTANVTSLHDVRDIPIEVHQFDQQQHQHGHNDRIEIEIVEYESHNSNPNRNNDKDDDNEESYGIYSMLMGNSKSHQIQNIPDASDTDQDIPILIHDSSDDEWNRTLEIELESDDDSIPIEIYEYSERINPNGINLDDIYHDNNLFFNSDDKYDTITIRRSNICPPNLDTTVTAGAFCVQTNTCTNAHITNNTTNNNSIEYDSNKIVIINGYDDPTESCILFSNAYHGLQDGKCILSNVGNVEYDEDELEDIYYGRDVQVIRSKNVQWYIHVPIKYENGKVIKTRVFADPGANTPCLNTRWAIETFPSMISKVNAAKEVFVPGGSIKPKYCLWLTFPTINGTLLKAKCLLVNKLPVNILADINMLKAFGYCFREETPEIFKHNETQDPHFELENYGSQIGNRVVNHNWFNCAIQAKMDQLNSGVLEGNEDDKIRLYDELYGNNKLLYPNNEIVVTSEGENGVNVVVMEQSEMKNDKIVDISDETPAGDSTATTVVNLVIRKDENEILNIDQIDDDQLYPLDSEKQVLNARDDFNDDSSNGRKLAPIFHFCMNLLARQSFLATPAEIKQAQAIHENKWLEFPNWDYLKSYPEKYGARYNGLYEAVMKWKEEYKDIFAKRTFDRVTMNTKPARLGIDPQHRDKVMYAPQYPLSPLQRLYLINFTLENERNGFWYHVTRSLHCMPILMVPKRSKTGVLLRYRPAYDARVINKYCILMPCAIPTFLDFRNLHQQRGTTTMADIKNYFDCIPLAQPDQQYSSSLTPCGQFVMKCMTYGHKNAAPEAQTRTNDLAMHIGNSLAYVDDIQIKHPFEEGTVEIIAALTRMGDYCRDGKFQLNPTKFYPACDESVGFGFKNTMIGEMISDAYRKKLLAFAKPTTKAEIKSFIGMITYVLHHLRNCKQILYWLTIMEEETKGKRLKWTKQGNLAFKQIQWLMAEPVILHHPTRDGRFGLTVDACTYGIGACLYQRQVIDGIEKWVLCDMWSKTMPKALRHAHSIIQEGYACVAAMEHWQFYLMRREFDLSTDNMPIARIFGKEWKVLSPTSQRQLLRLRARASMFTFVSHHVKGINNPIADGLSRYTMELLMEDQLLPPDQRQYPAPELAPMLSPDSNTPPLVKDPTKMTANERKLMDMADSEGQRLSARKKHLQDSINDFSINIISSGYQLDPSELDSEPRTNINEPTEWKQKYLDYKTIIGESWNDTMRAYINHANYLERDHLRDFIDANAGILVMKNEDSFNCDELNGYRESMINFMYLLYDLDNDSCNKIEENFHNEYWQHLIELRTVSDHLNGKIQINAIDEKYDYREDLSDLSDDIDLSMKHKMETRAKKKQRQQRARENREFDDDTLQDEERFSQLNPHFNDIRNYMESHEDFSYRIFGHRNDSDLLDFEKWREYQETDQTIAIAIKLFKEKDRSKWNKKDVKYLKQWDKRLYSLVFHDEVLIENHLLKYSYFNKHGQQYYRIIVPFYLRGKLIDYAHHNQLQHHRDYDGTLDNLEKRFWWSTLRKDVKYFCSTCPSCQHVKGFKRQRTPLVVRKQPQPLEHVFADLLGPIYGRFYVLVLVDYATGYCMLVPIEGADALSIIKAIEDYWFRIFGYFSIFESDWGPGFNNLIMKYLAKILGFPQEIAEPRNHRSIGKVERVIGFLQSVINHYNLLLHRDLTDKIDDLEKAWTIIKILLPLIQMAFNQRKMRITGVSPNMAIFGTNMNDSIDIARMRYVLKDMKRDKDLKLTDYEHVQQLCELIEKISIISKTNWEKYTYLSKKQYDSRHNITADSIEKYKKKFKVGTKVLYYIGDKKVPRGKWRQKWTGPWLVDKIINDTSLIIADTGAGTQKRVSFDRLKKFNTRDFIKYRHIIPSEDSYKKYHKKLMNSFKKATVQTWDKKVQLDYTKRKRKIDNG